MHLNNFRFLQRIQLYLSRSTVLQKAVLLAVQTTLDISVLRYIMHKSMAYFRLHHLFPGAFSMRMYSNSLIIRLVNVVIKQETLKVTCKFVLIREIKKLLMTS